MTCSQKKFALFLYLSKGIFKGYFASFAKDFNIRRYHLLTPSRKKLRTLQGASQEELYEQNYKVPHLIATRKAFWLGAFSKIQSMFTNILLT